MDSFQATDVGTKGHERITRRQLIGHTKKGGLCIAHSSIEM